MPSAILTNDHTLLRQPARKVATFGTSLHRLFDDMYASMVAHGGIGLAAPQIGVGLRCIIVDLSAGRNKMPHYRCVNPIIIKARGEQLSSEGCLSLPGVQVDVKRAARIKLVAFTPDGQRFSLSASGLMAACFQHEIDHLDGILITDRATGSSKAIGQTAARQSPK